MRTTIAADRRRLRRGLLDVHTDPDHHRSAYTLAGQPGELAEAVIGRRRARRSRASTSTRHDGVHPRVGRARRRADRPPRPPDRGRRRAPRRWCSPTGSATSSGCPVFLYGALGGGRTRAELRRGGPRRAAAPDRVPASWRPTSARARLHPTAGAVLVAARPPLVAFNVELAPPARRSSRRGAIAAAIREGGAEGLPGVRAIGLWLAAPRTALRSRPTSRTRPRTRRARRGRRRRAPRAGRRRPNWSASHRRRPSRTCPPSSSCSGQATIEKHCSPGAGPLKLGRSDGSDQAQAPDQAPRQRRRVGHRARAHRPPAEPRRSARSGRASRPARTRLNAADLEVDARQARRARLGASCSSSCCSCSARATASSPRSCSRLLAFAALRAGRLLPRDVPLAPPDAKAAAKPITMTSTSRMFTVGPRAGELLHRPPAERRPAVMVDPGDEAAAAARGAARRSGSRRSRRSCSPTPTSTTSARSPRWPGRPARPVYCPELEIEMLRRHQRVHAPARLRPVRELRRRPHGRRRRDARARRDDVRGAVHARPQPRPRELRAAATTARCSPATSCSRARSAASTCPAATGRRCWRRSAAARRLSGRDDRLPGPHGPHHARRRARDQSVPARARAPRLSSSHHTMSSLQAPRGTFDVLPADAARRARARRATPRGSSAAPATAGSRRPRSRRPSCSPRGRRGDRHRPEGDVHASTTAAGAR